MPIASANLPVPEKLLRVAARSGEADFHPEYQELEKKHGHKAIHRAADHLEKRGLIEWPDRKSPGTLRATEAGHAEVRRASS